MEKHMINYGIVPNMSRLDIYDILMEKLVKYNGVDTNYYNFVMTYGDYRDNIICTKNKHLNVVLICVVSIIELLQGNKVLLVSSDEIKMNTIKVNLEIYLERLGLPKGLNDNAFHLNIESYFCKTDLECRIEEYTDVNMVYTETTRILSTLKEYMNEILTSRGILPTRYVSNVVTSDSYLIIDDYQFAQPMINIAS